MKRPEGFDGTTVAAPPTRSERTPQKAQRPPKAQKAPPVSTPRPAQQRPRDDERARSAQAELRAAERARRAHDRAELRRFTARTRRRRLAWLSAGLVVAALVGLVAVAVYSPLLSLRHIEVEGTSRLDSATVAKAVDGQVGVPLALLDTGRLERELAAFTLIRSYTTELVPPDTMVIRISERQPIGTIQVGDSYELVDPAGVIISSSTTQLPTVPLIQLGSGQVGDTAFTSMADVLLALPPSVLAKVTAVSASTHDDVTLRSPGPSSASCGGVRTGRPARRRSSPCCIDFMPRAGEASTTSRLRMSRSSAGPDSFSRHAHAGPRPSAGPTVP